MADYNGYNIFGLTPQQKKSMTYTMGELESGKVADPLPVGMPENIPDKVSVPNVGNNQVVNNQVKPVQGPKPSYPGGTGAGDGMGYIQSLYTSPQQEEEYRKASVNKQRIMALGDALRHIGNIYHTTRYAPSQTFNSPVEAESAKYKAEKAVRDANNYKYMVQKQNEDKLKAEQAQREFENELKVANYDLNKQKADSQLKTDEARRKGYDLDAQKKQSDLDYLPTKRELERKNTESQIAAREDASKRGWANVGLARQRLALGWANHNLSKSRSSSRILATDKNKDYVYAPSGATYSFPKGTFTGTKGKANIETIYNQMLKKGLVPEEDFDTTLSDDDKLAYILEAASTASGHDDFVYAAKRLGYQYEGGMSPEYSDKIFKESRRRQQKAADSTKYSNFQF